MTQPCCRKGHWSFYANCFNLRSFIYCAGNYLDPVYRLGRRRIAVRQAFFRPVRWCNPYDARVPLSTRAHGDVLRRRAEDVFILAIILDFSAERLSGSPPHGARGSRHDRDFLQMGQYIRRTARCTAGRRIAGHRPHFSAQRYLRLGAGSVATFAIGLRMPIDCPRAPALGRLPVRLGAVE